MIIFEWGSFSNELRGAILTSFGATILVASYLWKLVPRDFVSNHGIVTGALNVLSVATVVGGVVCLGFANYSVGFLFYACLLGVFVAIVMFVLTWFQRLVKNRKSSA